MKMRESDGWWCTNQTTNQPDPDIGRRMSDGIAFHQTILGLDNIANGAARGQRWYAAVAMSDGTVDRSTFESRDDAVRHQKVAIDGNKAAYIPIPPVRWSAKTCDRLLAFWRKKYEYHNYRPVSGAPEIVIPNLTEQL